MLFLIFLTPLWIKAIPNKYLLPLTGKTTLVDKLVCNTSTKISGQSMSPLIKPGSSVDVNRCFEADNLAEGTVVLFNNNQSLRIGIIRHLLPLDPIIYKVSDEKAPELLHDVVKEEITGIIKNIDTSQSKYQTKQDPGSFILDADEFLTDLYLGKIPRGYGIEMATVEKTNIFFKDKDKFCSVFIPKKELRFVDIEIVDDTTQSVVSSSKNIIFGVRPQPNIDCQDFGSGQGMFNLDPGSYHYRFLLNHQVLKDIPFMVE